MERFSKLPRVFVLKLVMSSGFGYAGHTFPLVSKGHMFLPTMWLKLLSIHNVANVYLCSRSAFGWCWIRCAYANEDIQSICACNTFTAREGGWPGAWALAVSIVHLALSF